MNRYKLTYDKLKERGEIAFIPFAVAGDPDTETSERILRTYVDAGADILEIGYPFSDPVADGPVNQRAAMRAIQAGLTHQQFFGLIERLRHHTDIPIGVLIYANSVLHYGYERFCKRAASAGIDSLLVADMPPEESAELRSAMHRHGLDTVFIVSELTPPERIDRICALTDAFVYVVSRLGPTGVRSDMSGSVAATLRRLRAHTELPLCVGFGLSKPEHVHAIARAGADGAIVGSALVKQIERLGANKNSLIRTVRRMVSEYKKATVVS
jgi:tryptophan synthase alpha chain